MNRNDIEIAIRGGYNLEFCRVSTVPEDFSAVRVGLVLCDVDPPVQENTHLVDPAQLPPEARFRLHHVGKNNVVSKVVIDSTSGEASGVPKCSSSPGDPETSCESSEDTEIDKK